MRHAFSGAELTITNFVDELDYLRHKDDMNTPHPPTPGALLIEGEPNFPTGTQTPLRRQLDEKGVRTCPNWTEPFRLGTC